MSEIRFFEDLGHELRRAADQQPERRRRWIVSASGTVAAASAVLSVGIVVVAIALLHGAPSRRGPSTKSTPVPPAARQLFSILGVLRRPQTAADRAIAPYAPGGSDPALVRLAAVTPWGERVTLAPYRSGTSEELCIGLVKRPPESPTESRRVERLARKIGLARARLRLAVGSGGCGLTAPLIEAGKATSTEGAGREFAGGSTAVRVLVVVPDGVAKVSFVLPRQGPVPGGPVYPRSQSVTVPVHDNVAFAQINRECCNGSLAMRWYAGDDRVIKVIGNSDASNRVTGPKPAPETPLSRAAERNPSTPNPVHVVPNSGGPNMTFEIQWRLLLSDADYRITATGPNGPDCRDARDLNFIVGGGLDDVRGQLYHVTIPALRGQSGWCPGTYKVSVALYDLGLAGGLTHPDRPFGASVFTVRR
jgi:hypothetical protein